MLASLHLRHVQADQAYRLDGLQNQPTQELSKRSSIECQSYLKTSNPKRFYRFFQEYPLQAGIPKMFGTYDRERTGE